MSNKAWSDEEEQRLIDAYLHDTQDTYELSVRFGKGYRSVISKLVQLKIYVKPQQNEPDKGKTVKVMLRDIEKMLEIEVDGTNLNKKENLRKLVDGIEVLFNKANP